jgi:starch synthase
MYSIDSSLLIFVTIELSQYFKITGMGDLIRSILSELSKLGFKIIVIAPLFDSQYSGIRFKEPITIRRVFQGQLRTQEVRVGEDEKGIHYYFLPGDSLWDYIKQGGVGSRTETSGRSWLDFCHSVLMLIDGLKEREFDNVEKVIAHIFHWQSAPLLALLNRVQWRPKAQLVLTVDVLEEQGRFSSQVLDTHEIFHSLRPSCEGEFNFLLSGLNSADIVHTVSPSYAREIQVRPNGGGLEKVFRELYDQGRLVGILNGIDNDLVDWRCIPVLRDNGLCITPTQSGVFEHKRRAKEIFQATACLPLDPSAFLISMGHRFCDQKNFGLIERAMDGLMQLNRRPQIYLRAWPEPGNDDPDIDLWKKLVALSKRYRYNLAFLSPYDRDLSLADEGIFIDRFLYYAASDLFLMPSVWEPCGLCQLEGMRFGAVPLASAVGGLPDTVKPVTEHKDGWGFLLKDPTDAADFVKRVATAMDIWFNNYQLWQEIVSRAMNFDSSISKTVDMYLAKLYFPDKPSKEIMR